MKVYFGILKDEVTLKEAEKVLEKLHLKMVKFYPALEIIQFESESKIDFEIPVFKIVEEEKGDFRFDDSSLDGR